MPGRCIEGGFERQRKREAEKSFCLHSAGVLLD